MYLCANKNLKSWKTKKEKESIKDYLGTIIGSFLGGCVLYIILSLMYGGEIGVLKEQLKYERQKVEYVENLLRKCSE